MTWIKFTSRKPPLGCCVITRGKTKNIEFFEGFREWKNEYLKITPSPPRYWWDGVYDMEIAIKAWKNGDKE